MSAITKSEALNLSANLAYVRSRYSRNIYHVWIRSKENNGPYAIVERRANGIWRSRRVSISSVGEFQGKWLGGFKTRKIAAHAALVDDEPQNGDSE